MSRMPRCPTMVWEFWNPSTTFFLFFLVLGMTGLLLLLLSLGVLGLWCLLGSEVSRQWMMFVR